MKTPARKFIIAVLALLTLVGCQTPGSVSGPSPAAPAEQSVRKAQARPAADVLAELEIFLISQGGSPEEVRLLEQVHPIRPPEPEIDRRVAEELKRFADERLPGLPITVNAQVKRWIDVFQTRHRKYFALWLARSGRYIPIMQEILADHGLPGELVYQAMIESGFSCRAYSRAAAVGPWQFIRPTGRRYGLKIDMWVDERRDPIKATHAAARYLRFLYEEFGDWYLAAAGYNAGEARIRKALRYSKGDDFWDISGSHKLTKLVKSGHVHRLRPGQNPSTVAAKYGISTAALLRANGLTKSSARRLRPGVKLVVPGKKGNRTRRVTYRRRFIARETANYVPKIIAAAIIARNPEQYGFDSIDYHDPLVFDTVILPQPVDLKLLSKRIGTDYRTLRDLNPELRHSFTPPGRRDYQLRVPRGSSLAFLSNLASVRAVNIRAVHRHRVARGEYPGLIARKYKVSVQRLLAVNGITNPRAIRVGQMLKVPVSPAMLEQMESETPARAVKVGAKDRYHRLRRGETVGAVAQACGLTTAQLLAANHLTKRSARHLKVGQRLVIPGRGRATGQVEAEVKSAKIEPTPKAKAPKTKPAPKAKSVPRAKPAKTPPRVYVLKPGEYPGLIARRFGITVDQLLAANRLTRHTARNLKPGRELIIPGRGERRSDKGAARIHVLKTGETPFKVARLYGVELADLLAANGLTKRSARSLRPGRQLAIP